MQTSGPLTIKAAKDLAQTGIGNDGAVYLSSEASGSNAGTGSGSCVNYLNPAAYGLPVLGPGGNAGKGALHGPKLVNRDMGVFALKFIF